MGRHVLNSDDGLTIELATRTEYSKKIQEFKVALIELEGNQQRSIDAYNNELRQLDVSILEHKTKAKIIQQAIDKLEQERNTFQTNGMSLIHEIDSADKYIHRDNMLDPKNKMNYQDAIDLLQRSTQLTQEFTSLQFSIGTASLRSFDNFRVKCLQLSQDANEKIYGKPSSTRKILGALAIFMGALILTAAILALVVATSGVVVAAPVPAILIGISSKGIVVALTSAAAKIAMATGITGVATAPIVSAVGAVSFFSGVQKGPAKQAHHLAKDFKTAVDKNAPSFSEEQSLEQPTYESVEPDNSKNLSLS